MALRTPKSPAKICFWGEPGTKLPAGDPQDGPAVGGEEAEGSGAQPQAGGVALCGTGPAAPGPVVPSVTWSLPRPDTHTRVRGHN